MTGEVNCKRYKSLFLSDVHLGTRGCQADLLLDFLKHNDADTIYLSATLLMAGGLNAPGIGLNYTTMWCRSYCARPARDLG